MWSTIRGPSHTKKVFRQDSPRVCLDAVIFLHLQTVPARSFCDMLLLCLSLYARFVRSIAGECSMGQREILVYAE